MNVTVILGSNSGAKRELIEEAITCLRKRAGRLTACSSYYETAPWGFESEEMFLNRVAVFQTSLSPQAFLDICLQTEQQLGRIRSLSHRYTSRTIDIDLLFCDNLKIDTPSLQVPHPRIPERNFVLVPLAEVMPDFLHPVYRKKISELLSACPDTLSVKKITETF